MVIYKSRLPTAHIPDIDFYSFLFNTNEYNQRKNLDAPLVINSETGDYLTWNSIRDKSSRLAAGWTEKAGLKKHDVVAVFAPNQPEHIVLFLSLLGAKCIISPGNPGYTPTEFEHQIKNSQASALVTIPALLPVLLNITDKLQIPRSRVFLFGDDIVEGCHPFNSLYSENRVTTPVYGTNGSNDPALICYSSGTTGLPKGVVLTHRNLIAQNMVNLEDPEVEQSKDDEVFLGFLPFFHIFGLTSLVFNTFYRTVPVVVMGKFDFELLCKSIEKYKITHAAIVPPIAVLLAKHPLAKKYNLSSMRMLGCGGAPLSKEHIDALYENVPAQLVQGYGMTETTGAIISQGRNNNVPGSIGELAPNTECKIVNEKGEELGDDEEGEFLFRGPSIMKGYLNNPKANAEAFTEDGWMRSGDVGKYSSKNGLFYILDRIKELIKYKGYQVAPAELEATLMGFKPIADCCVVGVYDAAQATELPRAYVVVQSNVSRDEATLKSIHEYLNANVASHKRLRGGIKFVDAIPKSPSGKILRLEVKEWVKKEQSTAFAARL